jgi:parallel beta-helix repeat protein
MTPENERSFVYQDKRMQIAYEEHGQIYIAGDVNLTKTADAESWEGDGSEDLPYLIEGYNITLPGMSGRCIEIHNISLHLTIRDCLIVRGSVGLYLENVTDFDAEGNSFFNSGTGIAIFESSHITLTSNYFDSTAIGVFLTNVYDLHLADNIFESSSSYGVQGLGVTYSTFLNNSVHIADDGMWFASGCVGNEIRRNILSDR